MTKRILAAMTAALLSACCTETDTQTQRSSPESRAEKTVNENPARTEIATFGAGCFWCIEAVLEQLDGVIDVESGYTGGTVENPTYRDVCAGTTGHAEVVRVKFDPAKISYEKLLAWFFKLHDPTTLNRQGADVGTQYRSAIFYHTEEQRAAALQTKKLLDETKEYASPVVTEIEKAGPFYEAGAEHQDYYRLNKFDRYCRAVIIPKLDKLGLKK